MMLFVLSKINLLILVIALFTIIVYFTFSFQGMLISVAASQEVKKVTEQVSFRIGASNICGTIEVAIPEKIEMASGQGFYFVMEIRKVEFDDINSLVFSVINRETYLKAKRKGEEPTIIASERLNLKSNIHLFSLDEDDVLCPAESTFLGLGLRHLPIDNAVIVTESFKGKSHVFIVPCTSANKTSCEENTQRVACWIKEQRGSGDSAFSKCFDKPDSCPSPALSNCGS